LKYRLTQLTGRKKGKPMMSAAKVEDSKGVSMLEKMREIA